MLSPAAPGVLRRVLREEDGSTLMMYPFAILVVLMVGGIAVDAAVLFQAHREAVDVSAGLASDIAGVIDEQAFAQEQVVVIDRSRAADVLAFTNGVELAGHPNGLSCTASVDGSDVAVTCAGTARPILAPLSEGSSLFSFEVTSTATTDARG